MGIDTLKKYLWGSIPYFYLRILNPKSEKLKYLQFIRTNGYTHYPYDYAGKYADMNIEVKKDDENGLRYVIHQGKKLYFAKHVTSANIDKAYKALLIEQDTESSHRYVNSDDEFMGKTLIDVGAAEGLITLNAIEKIKFAYLFECDEQWIEALEATFAPWKEKICIIQRYISDNSKGKNLALDDFLKDKPKENLFLKMDIEGAEYSALNGASQLFSETADLDFAICTYHKKKDIKMISSFLKKHNCTFSIRKEYLYVKHKLRPGVARGHNNI